MKLSRRAEESISIAFLDVITCGIGAIILLLMISKPPPLATPAPIDDPRVEQIAQLQRQLFGLEDQRAQLEAQLAASAPQLSAYDNETRQLRAKLIAAQLQARSADQATAREAEELGQLKIAQQQLSEEMQRLYLERKRSQAALVGGIPVDSEYVVFIIDTSASMFLHTWPKVMQQIIETLAVYPRLKGLQVMNDQGNYMFPETRRQWLADSPVQRNTIIERLATWNPFSASSPAQGLYTAIADFYSPDKKISLYVYGDEFTGNSISKVVKYVASINPRDAQGRPQVRIHAIGFPTQFANTPNQQQTGIKFATLMRELTRKNGGTFVGLNAFR